jgi:hypothetical protein
MDGSLTTANFFRRVAQLEATRTSGVIVMWRHNNTETDDQAKARWRAEHQGEDPDKAALRVIIVGWGAPQP